MQTFNRRRDMHHAIGQLATTGKTRGRHNKTGTKPLTAIHGGIAHRFDKMNGGPGKRVEQQRKVIFNGRGIRAN